MTNREQQDVEEMKDFLLRIKPHLPHSLDITEQVESSSSSESLVKLIKSLLNHEQSHFFESRRSKPFFEEYLNIFFNHWCASCTTDVAVPTHTQTSWQYQLFEGDYEFQTLFVTRVLNHSYVKVPSKYTPLYLDYLIRCFQLTEGNLEMCNLKATALLHFGRIMNPFWVDVEDGEEDSNSKMNMIQARLQSILGILFDQCIRRTKERTKCLSLPITSEQHSIKTASIQMIEVLAESTWRDELFTWMTPLAQKLFDNYRNMNELEMEAIISLLCATVNFLAHLFPHFWEQFTQLICEETLPTTCKEACCAVVDHAFGLFNDISTNQLSQRIVNRICEFCKEKNSTLLRQQALATLNDHVSRYGVSIFATDAPQCFQNMMDTITPAFEITKEELDASGESQANVDETFTLLTNVSRALLQVRTPTEKLEWIDTNFSHWIETFITDKTFWHTIYTNVATFCDDFSEEYDMKMIRVTVDESMKLLTESDLESKREKTTDESSDDELEVVRAAIDFLSSAFECNHVLKHYIVNHPKYSIREITNRSMNNEDLKQVSYVMRGALHKANMVDVLLNPGQSLMEYTIELFKKSEQIISAHTDVVIVDEAKNNVLWSFAVLLRLMKLSTHEKKELIESIDWTTFVTNFATVMTNHAEHPTVASTLLFLYLELCLIEDDCGLLNQTFFSFGAQAIMLSVDDNDERYRMLQAFLHLVSTNSSDDNIIRREYLKEREDWNIVIEQIFIFLEPLDDCQLLKSTYQFLHTL